MSRLIPAALAAEVSAAARQVPRLQSQSKLAARLALVFSRHASEAEQRGDALDVSRWVYSEARAWTCYDRARRAEADLLNAWFGLAPRRRVI